MWRGLECKEFSQQELGEEVSTASAPGLGLSLTPGQEGGLSSSPFLAPSAAAAAGTVGRGLSLPAVPLSPVGTEQILEKRTLGPAPAGQGGAWAAQDPQGKGLEGSGLGSSVGRATVSTHLRFSLP